jgi:hypothetical protein
MHAACLTAAPLPRGLTVRHAMEIFVATYCVGFSHVRIVTLEVIPRLFVGEFTAGGVGDASGLITRVCAW